MGAVHGKPGNEALEGAARAASIGRLVTPDEIAEAVSFLAGPGADGMNGQSLVVDGGLHMS
jgi:NAD(P)-dependent dehydrogenase (short-subunit alcohol dehydrogenase family)